MATHLCRKSGWHKAYDRILVDHVIDLSQSSERKRTLLKSKQQLVAVRRLSTRQQKSSGLNKDGYKFAMKICIGESSYIYLAMLAFFELAKADMWCKNSHRFLSCFLFTVNRQYTWFEGSHIFLRRLPLPI